MTYYEFLKKIRREYHKNEVRASKMVMTKTEWIAYAVWLEDKLYKQHKKE